MLDFQQKRKARSLMYNTATIVILFILTLLVLHSTWRVYKKKRVSDEMRSISAKYVEDLRVRSEELDAKLKRLETTPGVEEEIRSRFSVVKENENMVVIVPNEEVEVSATSTKRGFWARIKSFFVSNE